MRQANSLGRKARGCDRLLKPVAESCSSNGVLNACNVSFQAEVSVPGTRLSQLPFLISSLITFNCIWASLTSCILLPNPGHSSPLPLAQHSASFSELSREVPRENGTGFLKGIHLCNEQSHVHSPAYLHRNLHTKATLQREGFFFLFLMPSHSSISCSSKNTIGITLTGRQNNFQGCWVRNNSFARPINV